MKTKLLFPLLILLLIGIVSVNSAPIPPYVIAGKLSFEDGTCVNGFELKANAYSPNEGKFVESKIEVNEECEYQLALGNLPYDTWYKGYEVEMTFCDLSKNKDCLKKVKIGYNGCEVEGGCRIDFIYGKTDYTPYDSKPIVDYKEVIKEVIKTVEVTKIVCKDGTEVINVDECLETDKQIKNYIYGAVGVLAGAGIVSLVRKWMKKGKRKSANKALNTYIKNIKKKK